MAPHEPRTVELIKAIRVERLSSWIVILGVLGEGTGSLSFLSTVRDTNTIKCTGNLLLLQYDSVLSSDGIQ